MLKQNKTEIKHIYFMTKSLIVNFFGTTLVVDGDKDLFPVLRLQKGVYDTDDP